MPATDPFKRYLDAGLEFTEINRKRAEKIVKELVKAGDVQRDQAQQRVEELIERSRHASAAFAEAVRSEVTRQLVELGLVQSPKKTPSTTAAPAKKVTQPKKPVAQRAAGAATSTTKKAAGATATGKKAASATTKATKKAAPAAKKATGQS